MACYEVRVSEVEVVKDWLLQTQRALFAKWSSTTGHRPGASGQTWACEIAHGCRICNEHLSLPCSLLSEANEIGAFLAGAGYSEDPAMFFRLYLMILSEFVAQLEGAGHLMKLGLDKKPRLVSLWANRWGKHRLQILLQHHPLMAFADTYGVRGGN